jgi:hypothetical protein
MLLNLLAALPLMVLALALTTGWLATSHLRYTPADPEAVLSATVMRTMQLVDRLLAGQAILLYGMAKHLMLLREFVAGLANISVVEAEPATDALQAGGAAAAASSSPRPSPLGGWLAKAMKAASTASRVQSRMYGHVVREITMGAGNGADAASGTPTPAGPAGTPRAAPLMAMLLRSTMAGATTPRLTSGRTTAAAATPRPGTASPASAASTTATPRPPWSSDTNDSESEEEWAAEQKARAVELELGAARPGEGMQGAAAAGASTLGDVLLDEGPLEAFMERVDRQRLQAAE